MNTLVQVVVLDKYGYPFCRGRVFETLEVDKGQYDDASEVFWASGACLFLRAEAFTKLVVLIGISLLIWKKLTYVGNLKTKVIKLCVSLNHLFFMLEEAL